MERASIRRGPGTVSDGPGQSVRLISIPKRQVVAGGAEGRAILHDPEVATGGSRLIAVKTGIKSGAF